MSGRLLRVTGTVLVIAVAFVTPVLATATATPAAADTVVNGCAIVASPTPTNFTSCPGTNFAGADLTGVNLSYANLAGAFFAACSIDVSTLSISCSSATLTDANFTQASLPGATFLSCAGTVTGTGVFCSDLTMTGAILTQANLSNAMFFSEAQLLARSPGGVDLTGANLTGANFTGTVLVPTDQTATAPAPSHKNPTPSAAVNWPTSRSLPGATPGSCTPPSGSTFPAGTTTVTCQVLDNQGDVAAGTFTVVVSVAVKSHGHK